MTDAMIVEAIRSIKMNQADNATGVQASAPQAVASPDAVARFDAAMKADGPSEAAKVNGIPFAEQVSELWRSTQTTNQELVHRIRALSELNGKEGFTSEALLELQYEVASLAFQQEVVAKVADKSSNEVQTLIKNQ
ncbi:MAG: hypothetical protein IJS15_09565 [Victivallales bacterium]|nr:hypothetical protein [Victivallales bacterium]